MGCKCGSQIILCNLPVRFDTYRGCSHGCRYCFAQKKNDISHIERDESVDGLPGFRPNEYNLCMLMNGKNPEPTEKMKEVGTGGPFKTLNQSAGSGRKIAKQSFYGLMQEELAKKTDYHRKVFGLDG